MEERPGDVRRRMDLLRDMGQVCAIAQYKELTPAEIPAEKDNVFETYDIAEEFETRVPKLLGAIALLEDRDMLATVLNVTRLSIINVPTGMAYMAAMTETGLVVPSGRLVRPFNAQLIGDKDKLIHVRLNQIGRVIVVYEMTKRGKDVLMANT